MASTETGTDKIDRVAMRDLAFWLPRTKQHLSKGIPFARTFEELVKLPVSQVGHIMAIIIRINTEKS